MFTRKETSDYKVMMPGIRMRPLVYEQKTILCEFILEKGHHFPYHNHPYEQTGYLISGNLKFRIGEDYYDACPGDSWSIPENIYHSVYVEEEDHVLELFSPVRPDYLPENLK